MPISGKEMVKLLVKNGWVINRIEGSHHIMRKGSETIIIPVHANRDLTKGIESSILQKAGLK